MCVGWAEGVGVGGYEIGLGDVGETFNFKIASNTI